MTQSAWGRWSHLVFMIPFILIICLENDYEHPRWGIFHLTLSSNQLFAKTLDFPGGSDGKVSVYNAGDPGSIPWSGRSPGEGMAIHSSTIAWKIPWTEEPGRLQSVGS